MAFTIMFTEILNTLTSYIVSIISAFGYIGVAFLMGVESAAVPLPSEVIMPFSGYLVTEGRFTLVGLGLAGALGSVVGSYVSYYVGKKGGRPFIEKYGKYLLISAHSLDVADRFFHKYGLFATFIARMLPIVRTFISVPAGIARVPLVQFLIYSFLGSFIWSYALAYMGFKLGPAWGAFRERVHWLDTVVLIVLALGALYWLYYHIKHAQGKPKT